MELDQSLLRAKREARPELWSPGVGFTNRRSKLIFTGLEISRPSHGRILYKVLHFSVKHTTAMRRKKVRSERKKR